MDKDQKFTPIFSKLIILLLIIVSIGWAAAAIWRSNTPINSSVSTSDNSNENVTDGSDTAPTSTINNTEINDEVTQLDKTIGDIDDASLSDTGYSDNDLGI